MYDKPVYVTDQGLAELTDELEELRAEKRPEIVDRLHDAKIGGDWMDNTEHRLIEDELAFVDARIQELQDMLASARLIRHRAGSQVVEVGSTVVIECEDGEHETYTIVGVAETDPSKGWISNECPLARALLGRTAGETVGVEAPNGSWQVRLLSVS